MTDWAQDLIEEMEARNIHNVDDATRFFCRTYENGDSIEAWAEYEAEAESSHDSYEFDPHGNHYSLLIFPDGSVYADWKEGIDRFYPCLDDLADEEDDIKEWMARA